MSGNIIPVLTDTRLHTQGHTAGNWLPEFQILFFSLELPNRGLLDFTSITSCL
jgi:hypothetical protein